MLGLYEVFYAGYLFLRLITAAILIYCVLSWFRPTFRAFYMLRRLIQPFMSPFQKLSMKVMRRFNAPMGFPHDAVARAGCQITGTRRLYMPLRGRYDDAAEKLPDDGRRLRPSGRGGCTACS